MKGKNMETNLLRLTDKYDDPVAELKLAANAVRHATRRVLERAVDNGPLGDVARALFKPRIRIAEDTNTVVVTMEAPGADRSSLEVTMSSKDMLCIKGRKIKKAKNRSARDSDSAPQVHSFERTLPLGGREVERDKATAYYENGLLTVTLPKLAKTSAPTISGQQEKPGIRAA
jgi:HSP20 family molecular chaperone IbpA